MRIILALLLLSGCASADVKPPPALELRTLEVSREVPGFEYSTRTCKKKGLFGGCREAVMHVEYYDLRDAEVRERLINTGFVGKVRAVPIK